LEDTGPNRIKVQRIEAKKRELVLEGRASELRLRVQPFNSAAEQFIEWCKGEYRDHENSWKRLRGLMTSAKLFFGRRPLSSISNAGDVEDYEAWRRATHRVREVTVRHDLHALSLLFQYGIKHNWCKVNPVRDVEIPSDKDAVRINVLSKAQELAYFTACEVLRIEKLKHRRTKEARGLQDLFDLHTLMVQQGCRPEELRSLVQADVDLEHSKFTIRSGKSDAARRTLRMRTDSFPIFVRRLRTPGKWVFPASDPSRHIGQHQRLHAAVVKRSGLLCVPYDFRHTFASRAANDEGVPCRS
jgi:integrase